MKRLLIAGGLIALFALQGTAFAAPSEQGKANAARACKALRAEMGTAAFKQTYGTNKNKSNAFGKCVSARAKAEHTNQSNAAQACKAERDADPVAFKAKYKNLGKCVSEKAKQKSDEQQGAIVNAAKTCRAERDADPAAFKAKYGTNKNKSNAFGKCVSSHAKPAPPVT